MTKKYIVYVHQIYWLPAPYSYLVAQYIQPDFHIGGGWCSLVNLEVESLIGNRLLMISLFLGKEDGWQTVRLGSAAFWVWMLFLHVQGTKK